MTKYRNAHVLTASLLGRFGDPSKFVVRSNVATSTSMRVPVGSQGFRSNLWQRTSAQFMESLWNDQAETDMGHVFKKLDNGTHLTLNDKKIIVRFLTVHYVRSNEFIRVYERLRVQKLNAAGYDPRLSYFDRYCIRLRMLNDTRIPGAFFEERMRFYYEKCLRYLSGYGIEIGVACGTTTFILPDGGMYVMDIDTGRSQPSGGVTLLQATNAAMPLGPRHIAAISSHTSKIKYRNLCDIEVRRANEKLKAAAIDVFYSRP